MSHTIPYLTEAGYDIAVQNNLSHNSRKTSFKKPKPSVEEVFSNSSILYTLGSLPRSNNQLQQPSTTYTMTFDMEWSPAFCLACDRQTDGNVYCSEACRLAEYENASTAGSPASSPTSPRAPVSWSAARQPSNGFFMEPYNFHNAQPYGTTPSPRNSQFSYSARPKSSPVVSKATLTPSSSQSSLFSMQSTHSSTSTEPIQLSDESRKALRAYASSFDQSRYSRRQSN